MEHLLAVGAKWLFRPTTLIWLAALGVFLWAFGEAKDFWRSIEAKDELIVEQAEDLRERTGERNRALAAFEAEQAKNADVRRQLEVAENGQRHEAARARRFERLLRQVENAPEESDGPLAPVLRDAAIGLRDELRGRTDADDQRLS